MAGIFISYRQADATAWAIALRDDLAKVLGEDQVFLDKDTLHAGNWRDQIHLALERCTVVLIVMGPRWLTIVDEQNRPRIGLAEDVHHQEIALALDRSGVTVIPVLVEDAPMPRAEQLPKDLQSLCDQQAYKIGDTQARRKADLEVLVKNIQTVGGLKARAGTTNRGEVELPVEPPSWFRLDITALGMAVLLTVCSAMLAYLSNAPFGGGETSFLFVLFYALAFGAKRLWRMRVERRKGTT
jgi:hypothetical protein